MGHNTKNTMGKDAFLTLIVVVIVVSSWVFFNTFFIPIPNTSVSISVLVLFTTQVVFAFVVAVVAYKKYRTHQNVTLMLIPLLLYYGISVKSIPFVVYGGICLSFAYFAISSLPRLYNLLRRKDPFEKLTYSERVDVLRRILKVELENLNIYMPVLLIPSGRLPADTHACYYYITGVIEINKWSIMEARPDGAILGALVAHEVMHCYQFERLLLLNHETLRTICDEEYADIEVFRREFLHYKTVANAGARQYKNQKIEIMARHYAKKRRRFYRKHLPEIVSAYQKRRTKKVKTIG